LHPVLAVRTHWNDAGHVEMFQTVRLDTLKYFNVSARTPGHIEMLGTLTHDTGSRLSSRGTKRRVLRFLTARIRNVFCFTSSASGSFWRIQRIIISTLLCLDIRLLAVRLIKVLEKWKKKETGADTSGNIMTEPTIMQFDLGFLINGWSRKILAEDLIILLDLC